MALSTEVVIMLFVINVLGHKQNEPDIQIARRETDTYSLPRLPDTYKDVFKPGSGGKPMLGTMAATCWARGGICVDIRECPSLRMDVGISGCSWGHKICCIAHRLLSPTVGMQRRAHIPVISQPEDLGSRLQAVALKNSIIFPNVHDVDRGKDIEDENDFD